MDPVTNDLYHYERKQDREQAKELFMERLQSDIWHRFEFALQETASLYGVEVEEVEEQFREKWERKEKEQAHKGGWGR